MGAFKTEFECAGEIFDVRWFKFGVTRGTNNVGKVTTTTQGGKLQVRVASSSINKLAETMVVCEHTPFNCKIVIYEGESTGVMKEITLEHCVMTGYTENFNADSDEEASTMVEITANMTTIGNAQLLSNWTNTANGAHSGKV